MRRARRARREAVEPREENQILLDRQAPVEAALLGAGEADLRAHALLVAHAVEAAHDDRARGRLDERGDDLGERRLARAVATDEAEDFALAHLERDAAERRHRLLRLHPEDLLQASSSGTG